MSIAENVETVRARVADACERSGREPESVQLMAVSKTHSVDAIGEAVDAGLTLFGENKIQEAKLKISQCPPSARWHFIGHIQSNKARDAVRHFEMLHGVDSLRLAEELNKRATAEAREVKYLLEINVAGESSKYGYSPAAVLEDIERLAELPRLELHGLMAVPPFASDPERSRPFFRRLVDLKDACEQKLGVPLGELSMGMSGDFEIAIEEGATIVRVGTAVFGPRRYRKPGAAGAAADST
jgi:pyridoxal phosphate enzyme (YggS family)